MSSKRRRPIALALGQSDIRLYECGNRVGMWPGEILRKNNWQVHPAIMAGNAGQRQAKEPDENGSGLCRIAYGAVRGDQARDAAYSGMRHSRRHAACGMTAINDLGESLSAVSC